MLLFNNSWHLKNMSSFLHSSKDHMFGNSYAPFENSILLKVLMKCLYLMDA